jgi:hypothetical protein
MRALLLAVAACHVSLQHASVIGHQFRGRQHILEQASSESKQKETCGITVAAFGKPDGKFMMAAVANALKIHEMKPGAGWCPLDPSLEHVPITLITDMTPNALVDHYGRGVENLTVMSNQTFDKIGVDINSLASGWWAEGDPIYRWYHCQTLLRSPYDLTLYLDADATVCSADKLVKLFKTFSNSGADMAFQNSLSPPMWFMGEPIGEGKGFHCTEGDAENPRPAEVGTDADMNSWVKTDEPNAGVMFFAKQHAAAQKVASDWCSAMEATMRSKAEPMPCDQYALRVAFWKNRQDFKALTFGPDADEICRYGERHFSGCDRGCDIVHGWSFKEVKELLPTNLRD